MPPPPNLRSDLTEARRKKLVEYFTTKIQKNEKKIIILNIQMQQQHNNTQ